MPDAWSYSSSEHLTHQCRCLGEKSDHSKEIREENSRKWRLLVEWEISTWRRRSRLLKRWRHVTFYVFLSTFHKFYIHFTQNGQRRGATGEEIVQFAQVDDTLKNYRQNCMFRALRAAVLNGKLARSKDGRYKLPHPSNRKSKWLESKLWRCWIDKRRLRLLRRCNNVYLGFPLCKYCNVASKWPGSKWIRPSSPARSTRF